MQIMRPQLSQSHVDNETRSTTALKRANKVEILRNGNSLDFSGLHHQTSSLLDQKSCQLNSTQDYSSYAHRKLSPVQIRTVQIRFRFSRNPHHSIIIKVDVFVSHCFGPSGSGWWKSEPKFGIPQSSQSLPHASMYSPYASLN